MRSKVASIEEVVDQLNYAKKKLGLTSVVTNGCFDLLHRGHVEYLDSAAYYGDCLTVVLNSDKSIQELKGKHRPIVCQEDRAFMLSALPFVSFIIICDEPRLDNVFKMLPIDVYVKGGDYNIHNIDKGEKAVLLQKKCEMEFIKFVSNFSTTNLIEKIKKLP